MSRSVVAVDFRRAFVQPGADVVRRVGVAAALVPSDEHTPGRHPDDTGQSEPLPDVVHTDSVPKLPW